MNREDIIRMAREAGCIESAIPDWVIRTCALVASAEREACAKLLEQAAEAAKNTDPQGFVWRAVKESAEAIRKGGL